MSADHKGVQFDSGQRSSHASGHFTQKALVPRNIRVKKHCSE